MSRTVHRKAAQLGGTVVGPLGGHHHEAYAVRTSRDSGSGSRIPWVKVRVRRSGIIRYDQRCFKFEEPVLDFLVGRVPRIPRVVDPNPVLPVHSFIEGRTLREIPEGPEGLDALYVDQIMEVFESLCRIDTDDAISIERVCNCPREQESNGSRFFFRRLLEFIRSSAHDNGIAAFRSLLADFGVSDRLLAELEDRSCELTDRPYVLIHGDLHRDNFVVDDDKNLWTIDWELARIGDPLYELATHLYLMRYPEEQERVVVEHWKTRIEAACTGATFGADADLRTYLDFKRVQSAHTDLMRAGWRLAQLRRGGRKLDEAAWAAAPVIADVLKAVEQSGFVLDRPAPSVDEAADLLLSWRRGLGSRIVLHRWAMKRAAAVSHPAKPRRALRDPWNRIGDWCDRRLTQRRTTDTYAGQAGAPVVAESEAASAPVPAG
ncbi:phosphotransferase family protein [Streptomyces sp. NPDC058864]